MKLKRSTYFSIGFLLLFLTSFSTNLYSTYNNSLKNIIHFSKQNELKRNGSDSATESLVFEETENDCKDDAKDGFEFQSFLLSFIVSCFSFEVSTPQYISVQTVTEKLHTPIYVSLRNFRI
jgi:hypothetical protein